MTERALPVTILEPAGIDPELLDHSLSLRFDLGQFDPRITFTRNSSATYFGSDGLLKTASANEPRIDYDPVTGECKGFLVEESRTNLLLRSAEFDDAAWVKSGSSVTQNSTIAPDGTLSADALVEDASTGAHETKLFATLVVSTQYALSVFAKAGSRTQVRVAGRSSGSWSLFPQGVFDLLSGTVLSSSGERPATIQSVGNGWYRCTVYGTASNTGAGITVGVANGGTGSYIGDGTSGIYIWGAQLEAGAFPTSYIPTPAVFTSRNSTGTYFDSTGVMRTAAINEPRYDHGYVNGQWVSKGLVLESSATNLVVRSVPDSSWKTTTNSSLTYNVATAPDGTSTASRMGTNGTGASVYVYNNVSPSYTAGTTYVASCYLRLADGFNNPGIIRLVLHDNAFGVKAEIRYNLATKEIIASGSPLSYGVSEVGGGWVRVWVAKTATTTTTTYAPLVWWVTSSTDTNSAILVWGVQLEVGTQPTSYIKTEGTTVTRAADLSTSSAVTRAADNAVMTGTNFSSWYRQDEGAFFVEALSQSSAAARFLSVNDGVAANRIDLLKASSGQIQLLTMSDGAASTSNVATVGVFGKAAAAYKVNDIAAALLGGVVAADSTASLPSAVQINIGATANGSAVINGYIKRLAYYPKRLSNAKLQALTQ